MKKHHKKHMREGSVAEEAMESPSEEAKEVAEGTDGMKRGGKAKKKSVKAEGKMAKMRLDKPKKYAEGGSVLDTTNAGVSPSRPFAESSPMRKNGGKV